MRFLSLALLAVSAFVPGQTAAPGHARTSPYFQATNLDFADLIPPPPEPGSALAKADMEAVLEAQRTRTAGEIAAAQHDDQEEDIFIFAAVLGTHFNAQELPDTAALSLRLRQASAVINPTLKTRFNRPRPFRASPQVHAICEQTASNSYPSGHTMVGTLEALALTQIVPERAPEILRRLDEYTHNRVVCGVHYPSDTQASRTLAIALFGLSAANPVFQSDLAAARSEVRTHLKLPLTQDIHQDTSAASASTPATSR